MSAYKIKLKLKPGSIKFLKFKIKKTPQEIRSLSVLDRSVFKMNLWWFTFFEVAWSVFLQKEQNFELTMAPRAALTSLNLLSMMNEWWMRKQIEYYNLQV